MFYLARQYKEKCPVCFQHMGDSLMARGQYDRALWCWQQSLDLESDRPHMHARMADACWAKGRLAEARAHFLEELRTNPPRPGDVGTLLDLGALLIEMNEHDAAGEKFRQVLELDPEETTAHFQLAELARAGGDEDTALASFRHVIRNDKTFPGAHLRVAQIHLRRGALSEALYHANCELAQVDIGEETLLELGNLFMDLRQHASAETAFTRVLATNPQSAEAEHNLAVTLFMANRVDEGIEHCRRALRIQPKFMLALSNLALAYMGKKDYTRASYFLREALDIAPEDPQLKQIQSRLKFRATLAWLKTLPRRMARRK
jgi:tetratricopeptide (TPR) repeat protein